jgi:PAS domain S-box-containing protein
MHEQTQPLPPTKTFHDESDDIPPGLGSFAEAFRDKALAKYGAQVKPDYTTVVDINRKYVEVSDSFCELVGYSREELIGRKYDELTAPGTNNIPVVFELFARTGYMHGLWMLVNRAGTHILVRYEALLRPDRKIQGIMELVDTR